MDVSATVLIIEDSPVVQHLLRATLTPLGLDLLFADDGESGLELALAHAPSLITLDIGLPGIDGWDVLSKLRSDPVTAGIDVIVVTAHAQESMREAAADRGAEGFVTKPFRPAELRTVAAALLARSPAACAVNS
ncbi:MAG: response regulator [Acidimicrobiia bacterium]|nr:response regulator [Acidimicrobiia bacterium]NNJ48483.1 response regulator [Acidimicrobiia bacterium]NNL14238.1 response regulator [Acidimicrobiia bacterium]